MQRFLCAFLFAALAAPSAARGQEILEVKSRVGANWRCAVRWPRSDESERMRWAPLLVVFVAAPGDDAAKRALQSFSDLEERGFRVVCPVRTEGTKVEDLALLFTDLRKKFRIEQGGMHAAVGEDADPAIAAVLANRAEFQTFTAFGDAAKADLAAIRRLPGRRVHALPTTDRAALMEHFVRLHAERTLPGVAGEVAHVLDDFHDAAANGDEKRYFAILPDDAVFLGTDATERWTGVEFREFAMPYFQRDSAWTYVCLHRHVDVEPGDVVAWFDEAFDNAAYGECRGSGVLAKRGDHWVLRQYHLTIPVPNDLAPGVAVRIRRFQSGRAPGPTTTTIVVVRHAEKASESGDPELSEAGHARAAALAKALRDVPFTAVFTSQRTRTSQTVAPLCKEKGLTSRGLPAANVTGLADELRRLPPGETALVCGHSNTVPELLKALGVKEPVTIAEDEYDRLFVVTLDPQGEGTGVLALRYPGS